MTSSPSSREDIARRLVLLLGRYQRRWAFCQNTGMSILFFVLIVPFVVYAVLYDMGFWSVLWRGLVYDFFLFLGFAGLIYSVIGGTIANSGLKAFEKAFPSRKKEDRQTAVDILGRVKDPNALEHMMYVRLPEIRLSLYTPPSAPPEQQLKKGLNPLLPESSDGPQVWAPAGDEETKPPVEAKPASPAKRGRTHILLDTGKKLVKQGARIARPRKMIQLEPEKYRPERKKIRRTGRHPEKGVNG